MHEQVIDRFLLHSNPQRKIELLPKYRLLHHQTSKKDLHSQLSLLVYSIELALLWILGIKLQSISLSSKAQSMKEVL